MKYILTFTAVLVLFYLTGAFIEMSFNIGVWTELMRGEIAAIGLLVAAFSTLTPGLKSELSIRNVITRGKRLLGVTGRIRTTSGIKLTTPTALIWAVYKEK